MIFRLSSQNQVIHPDSEENVRATREQMNQRYTERRASRQNTGEITCPICLGHAVFAIETNCGHVFCGKVFFLNLCNTLQLVIYFALYVLIASNWYKKDCKLISCVCFFKFPV